jgi:hypothetical protein
MSPTNAGQLPDGSGHFAFGGWDLAGQQRKETDSKNAKGPVLVAPGRNFFSGAIL